MRKRGFVAEPGSRIGDRAIGARQAAIENQGRERPARFGGHPSRARIDAGDQPIQPGECFRIREIAFGENDAVGDRQLPPRLDAAFQIVRARQPIDHADDAVEHVMALEIGIGHEGGENGRGIGEAGRLDHDPRQGPALSQPDQGLDEFAAHRAAQTPVGQFDQPVTGLGFDEHLIDADLAEFVDDDRRVGEARLGEKAIEDGRLSRPQKAGQERQTDGPGGGKRQRVGHDAANGGSPGERQARLMNIRSGSGRR